MHKKFEINQTKIKDGCQSGRKVVNHNSKGELPLSTFTWLTDFLILCMCTYVSVINFSNFSIFSKLNKLPSLAYLLIYQKLRGVKCV